MVKKQRYVPICTTVPIYAYILLYLKACVILYFFFISINIYNQIFLSVYSSGVKTARSEDVTRISC